MIKEIVTLIILALCIFILDFIAISTIFKKVWEYTVLNIQGSQLQIRNYLYPLITYIFIILGVYFFVFPRINKDFWKTDCLLWGFLWGVLVYGIFDFTNLSIFINYNLFNALVDVLWGGILVAISTFITYAIIQSINFDETKT